MTAAMEFVENLWSHHIETPPTKLVSPTSEGVARAIERFMYLFLKEDELTIAHSLVKTRTTDRINFRTEFTRLLLSVKDGRLFDRRLESFLLIGVGLGGAVQYTDAIGNMNSEPVAKDAAVRLFAEGAMAIVVDIEGTRTVSVYGWYLDKLHTFGKGRGGYCQHPLVASVVTSQVQAEDVSTEAQKYTRDLVKRAQEALLNESLWVKSQPS
tara:strand:- start:2858 stop:3490 length:633 start_codon:yes stop_codon:yes gene_type:complete